MLRPVRCLALCLVALFAILPFSLLAAEPFPAPPDTQEVKDVKLPSPDDAVKKMTVPPGFRVTPFAAEPVVQQPIAFCTDERGRLWVAENYTYAESKVNFATQLRDRIVILEDTDHDGRCDRRTVFWDQGTKLTAVTVGFGGVWALCAPQLLFLPDRNRDDVPDGPPEVLLDGWNDEAVRHNIVNGLTLGPDGWLYGRHGILATSLVGRPGAPAAQRTPINCGIWRFHPVRRTFETVAHGTTNPWGFDFDEHGQMFFINTVIGHLWHIVPGAHYHRMYGAHFNPHVYDLIDQCADHFHWDTREPWHEAKKGLSSSTSQHGGGHAHSGLLIYQGDNWPAEFRGNVLTCNLHGTRLNRDRLARRGGGYVATHAPDPLAANDPWFRVIDLLSGNDGGVYLADWADIGECHENDGVHRSSGRIYKVTFGSPARPTHADLATLDDRELVGLQRHANDWYARHARRLLQERALDRDLTAARAALFAMFDDEPDAVRKLRALWCLHAIGALDEAWLTARLEHPNEHVRTWAVKLLTELGPPTPERRARFVRAAREDASGLVRLFLASALQRWPYDDRWELADALAARAEDANDPQIPRLIWYGVEPAVPGLSDRAVALVDQTRLPSLRRLIARRLAGRIDAQPAAVDALVRQLRLRDDPAFRRDVLGGFQAGLRGFRQAPAPRSWSEAAASLTAVDDPEIRDVATDLSVVFGDGRAADALQRLVTDNGGDLEARRRALRVLVETRDAQWLPLLTKLVGDRAVGPEAIRGLSFYDHAATPDLVLTQYARLDPTGREEAINTLTSRPVYARALLSAIADGKVDRRDLSAFHVRQVRSFGDESLTAELARVWGEIRTTPADKQAQIAALKKSLTPSELSHADLANGRQLFAKNCANCHTLFGQGARIGPDLTGGNRHNLDYLLENIVDPSATVAADFRLSLLELENGRVLNGVVVEQSERTLVVQTAKERVPLERREIARMVQQNLSLMPDGLLQPLTPAQVRDLFAYLGSRQ